MKTDKLKLPKKVKISETLKKITNNFEEGFYQSTMMAWEKNYDFEGRLLNPDHNFRDGCKIIEGKKYWYTRRGWEVRIWDRKTSYTDFMADEKDFIEKVDLTPDYIRERGIKS